MRKGYKVTISLNKKPLKQIRNKNTKKKEISDESLSKGIDIINNHKSKQQEKRQERIGKTLVEVKNELIEQKEIEKEYRRSRKRFSFIIFALGILFLIYLFFTFGPIFGISLYKNSKMDEENKIDITSTDEDFYDNYCEELLIYNNRKLTTYNHVGSKTWEYELQDIFTPNIYINGKYMAVTNNTNGTIYLFENKKELFTKKIDGEISYIYVNDNGIIAIEYSTSGYKKVIGVYSKSGKLLYNTYLQVSSILDIEFLDDEKELLVITSDSTTFNVGATISIVDGTKEQDNIKEVAKFENNLIYDIVIQNNNAIIMLDNKIVNCSINTGTVTDIKSFDESQILFNALLSNYYTYVEKELGSIANEYNINTVRFDGTSISNTKCSNSPKLMENSGYLNYFVYQDKLQVINKWGVEIKNIDITFPPKEIVIFNKEKCVALIYSNKIYFVNM